jgi:TetR/AcrR family transcriptional regulator
LRRWQADGQLARDLDLLMTVRWLHRVPVMLMTLPWAETPVAEKRAFLDRFVIRALLPPAGE